jgi:hypothetical protein
MITYEILPNFYLFLFISTYCPALLFNDAKLQISQLFTKAFYAISKYFY